MPLTIFPPALTPVRPFDPQIGKYQRVAPVGYSMVDSYAKEVGGGFAFSPLDSVEWTAANSGAGSAAGSANMIATVTSGTANSGYGTINSAVTGRFLYATSNLFRGTFRIPAAGGANTTRSWGAFNFGTKPAIQDGFFFSYDGSSSTFSINSSNAGVTTSVASGSFNGEVSSYTLDTNQHLFEIIYQVVTVWFFVDGVLIHKLKPTTALLTASLQLAAAGVASNSASGTTSASLEIWSMNILKMTSVPATPLFFHITAAGTNTIKLGPGTLRAFVVNTASGAGGSATIYDSTTGSGAVIAVVSTATASGATALQYGVDLRNGLTVVTAGAAGDYTVVYD